MLRSRTARPHKRRWMATTMVAMFAPLLLLTAPAAAEDFPPVITNAHISPGSLPSNGGTVTVTADVVDDISVFSVGANAYGPGFLSAPMLLTGLDAGTYTGTFEIGPNFNEDSVNYQIEVVAIDGTSGTTMEFIGDVEVRGNPPFDEKPIMWDPSVSPTSLPRSGGPVNLAVSAWDLRGITEAYASITGPVGESNVPLQAISADRFTGVFNAPANTGIFPAYYEIEFSAMDDIGQQTTVSGERVTVAARRTGQLEIKRGDRDFGKVKRGKSARRTIVVKNRGAKGTLPIGGLIQTSGAPFSVVGQTAAGVAFSLKPGESKTYHVEFRPTALGRFTGQVNVVRTDSGQPGLHALLIGRGT
jgi:Abnormal spindle-like microcephaly-assoc'd, ASPM-SPD-2-Hydin